MAGKIVIDGKNAILGRLASYAAKQALLGKEIIVVNCDGIVVSGRPRMVIGEYNEIRKKGGSSLRGPYFPKQPENLLKRTIRGMLSYKQGRGEDALKRIKCFGGTPQEYKDLKKIVAGKEKSVKTMTLKELEGEI